MTGPREAASPSGTAELLAGLRDAATTVVPSVVARLAGPGATGPRVAAYFVGSASAAYGAWYLGATAGALLG